MAIAWLVHLLVFGREQFTKFFLDPFVEVFNLTLTLWVIWPSVDHSYIQRYK